MNFCSKNYTRAYLHTIVQKEAVACHLLTIHNIAYQLTLMRRVRESIMEDRYSQFFFLFLIFIWIKFSVNVHRPISALSRFPLALFIIKTRNCCAIFIVHCSARGSAFQSDCRLTEISNRRFPEFIRKFFRDLFPSGDYPEWAVNALKRVNVDLTVTQ